MGMLQRTGKIKNIMLLAGKEERNPEESVHYLTSYRFGVKSWKVDM